MVELEKRCAHMDEGFGCEMSGRLRDVDLSMDEHGFVRAFLSVPLPPPPVPHLPPSGAASVMFGIQPANAESRTNPFHNSTGNMLINNGSDGCILDASDVPRQSHQHHCKTASGMMPPAYDSPVSMRGGGMTPPRRSGTVSLGDLLYSS